MADLIQIRRDTRSNWHSANPVLEVGEIGLITGNVGNYTGSVSLKVGNGVQHWDDLPEQALVKPDSFTSISSSFSGSEAAVDARVTNLSSSLGTISGSIHTNIGEVSTSLGTISTSLHTDMQSTSASIMETVTGSYAKQDGYYSDLTAGLADDLDGDIGRVSTIWQPIIRTTGGNLDLKSDQPAYLLRVVGGCNASGVGFTPSGIRFNGFNALIPGQSITGTLAGSTVATTGTNKIAYFRCVKGTWGGYNVLDENNGYLFTDNNGQKVTPINVKTTAVVPAAGVALTSVTTHTESGYTYYLPGADGLYLCAEFASSVNLNNVCAHVAWDNEDDDKFETRSAATIDLSSVMSNFTNGLLGIGAGSSFVADEIVFNAAVTACTWYRRLLKVAAMSSLTWTEIGRETSEDESTTTYIFQATLSSAAANNPVNLTSYSGGNGSLYWDGANLKFSSTTVTTAAGVQTELGSNYMIYQLASAASGNVTLSGSAICNDMGTEEVLGSNVEAGIGSITTSYVGGIKNYIERLPVGLSDVEKVIAQTLTDHKAEIDGLKTAVGSLSAFLFTEKIDSEKIFTEGSGSPNWIPAMPWQFYRDRGLATPAVWVSTGNTAATQWVKITA